MKNYVIRANRETQVIKMLGFREGAQTVTFDYSPWEDDNGTVTTVVPQVKSGEVSLTNTGLTSSVFTMRLGFSESGHNLIRLVATAGNNIHVVNLFVLVKDPFAVHHDYGLFSSV